MAVAKGKAKIVADNKKHLVIDVGMGIVWGLYSSIIAAVVAIPIGAIWGFSRYVANYNGWSVPLLSSINGFQIFALIVLGVIVYHSYSDISKTLATYRSYQHRGIKTYMRESGSTVWNTIKGITWSIFVLPLLVAVIALIITILIHCLFGWDWSVFFSQWLTVGIVVWVIGIPFAIHSFLYKDQRDSHRSIYAGYYGHHAHTPTATPASSTLSASPQNVAGSPSNSLKPSDVPGIGKKGTTYKNTTNMWGDPVVKGSDGTTYAPTTNMWGDPIMKGSDGTTIKPDTNMWGDKVLRSSKGVTYTNTTDMWGDPIVQGSDGSKYKPGKDMFGDDKMTRIK